MVFIYMVDIFKWMVTVCLALTGLYKMTRRLGGLRFHF